MTRIRPMLAALLVAGAPVVHPVAAQGTQLDEGSLTISRDGDRVGREDFTIRRVPTVAGAYETVTRGVVNMGTQRRTVELSADASGLPARFQSKVSVDGRTTETYRAEILGRRLSARSVRTDGESAREMMIPPGALLVEDGILHLLQFVVAKGAGATVSAIVPSRNVVVALRVEDAGPDKVAVALQSYDAHKYVLREVASGAVREVWVDAGGRLLKVALPDLHLVAVRDDAPPAIAR